MVDRSSSAEPPPPTRIRVGSDVEWDMVYLPEVGGLHSSGKLACELDGTFGLIYNHFYSLFTPLCRKLTHKIPKIRRKGVPYGYPNCYDSRNLGRIRRVRDQRQPEPRADRCAGTRVAGTAATRR